MKDNVINIKDFNEVMSSLKSNNTKKKYFVSESKGHIGIPDNCYDGEQGEYNERFEFFRHPDFPENIFMKITYITDSYGDNETKENIEFVEGKVKTVTVYEPIN